MKRYVFEVVIDEGYDEFWEGFGEGAGVDQLEDMISAEILYLFPDAQIRLVKYTNNKEVQDD